jgi:predicted permease
LNDILKIGLIPALMLLGMGLGRARVGVKAQHLEFLIINFTAPVLMFTEILKANLGAISIAGVAGISLLYLSLCFLLSYGSSRKLSGRERGTVVFNSTFFNSMFLPFPLIYAFYGDLSVALLFSLPIAIVHNTLGIFLASYWGHGRVGRRALVGAVTFPPLVAFFAGALARPALYGLVSTPLFGLLSDIGLLTVYLSLIFVGLAVPLSRDSLLLFRNRVAGLITLNRFLASPLLALLLTAFLNPAEAVRNTVIVMSFMPPAFTNLVIASRFGLDVRATSQSLFLPTFVSVGIVFALRFFSLL